MKVWEADVLMAEKKNQNDRSSQQKRDHQQQEARSCLRDSAGRKETYAGQAFLLGYQAEAGTKLENDTMQNPREYALDDLLIKVDKKKNYHTSPISNVLEKYSFLKKKRPCIFTRLVEGTLESITIDYVADQFSKTKTENVNH